jgi:hypothetical protein
VTSNVTYVRWRAGESRRGRVFPSLEDAHPASRAFCVIGGGMLGTAEPVQLVIVGPSDEVDREQHAEGRWYSAGAVVVHKRCLDELDDNEVEGLVKGLYIYIEDTA